MKPYDASNKVQEYLEEVVKQELTPYTSSIGCSIGKLTMSNGKRAQLQVILEMDENEWNDE